MPLLGKREEVRGAVRFQTLTGHTKDVLWVLKQTMGHPNFSIFCCRWQLNEADLKEALAVIAALHDIGKATKAFQNAIQRGTHRPDIPHALIALPVACEIWQSLSLPRLLPEHHLPIVELLAIVSHHALLYDELYQVSIRHSERLNFLPDAPHALTDIWTWASQQGLLRVSLPPNLQFQKWSSWELKRCAQALRKLREINQQLKKEGIEVERLKALYTFALAHLKFADQWASRKFSEQASQLTDEVVDKLLPDLHDWQLPSDAAQWVRNKLTEDGKQPYRFQEQLAQTEAEQVVLLAPCGRGKTEGALLFASAGLEPLRPPYPCHAHPSHLQCYA
jgi:CRISPR-associated endonuclease/helicase Cas3